MSKCVLKRWFLDSDLTESLTGCNFRNQVAMTMIFVSRHLKFDEESRNGTKESEKVFGFKDNCI